MPLRNFQKLSKLSRQIKKTFPATCQTFANLVNDVEPSFQDVEVGHVMASDLQLLSVSAECRVSSRFQRQRDIEDSCIGAAQVGQEHVLYCSERVLARKVPDVDEVDFLAVEVEWFVSELLQKSLEHLRDVRLKLPVLRL